MFSIRNLSVAIAVCGFFCFSTVVGQTTLRFAHVLPADSPWRQRASEFAQSIEKQANGRLHIQVFPAAQLGDSRTLAQSARSGTLDLALIPVAVLSEFNPGLTVFELPFLFDDLGAVSRFQKSKFDLIQNSLRIFWYPVVYGRKCFGRGEHHASAAKTEPSQGSSMRPLDRTGSRSCGRRGLLCRLRPTKPDFPPNALLTGHPLLGAGRIDSHPCPR